MWVTILVNDFSLAGLVIYLICWLVECDPIYWYVSSCLLCHFFARFDADYLAYIWFGVCLVLS
jgi:hypothetical protein